MPLSLPELIAVLRRDDLVVTAPAAAPTLTDISTDSRRVVPGSLYIAVRGSETDGHRFTRDVAARGAAALVVETPQGLELPEVIVRDGRAAALTIARAWYGDPGRTMQLIGITGTNGKTTTTGLVRHLLNDHGTAASIGTLGAFDGAGRAVPSTAGSLTTPGAIDLQATLAALRDRGTESVAMETSSHSLDQGRLDGLTFVAAVYTNLTRDHLDYHGTMAAYLAAKLRLSSYLSLQGAEVVNLDDEAWQALPARGGRVTFGVTAGADVLASGIHLDASGSSFRLTTPWGSADAQLPLLGDFNVQNALAAAATALALGRPFAQVVQRLAESPQVPGRMERIGDRPCVILRDYAHTPDALARALAALRPLTAGRLIVVFGCGGDRDRGKRPIMGRIAADGADLAIVSSDNPRTEDPDAIIDDVVSGMGGVPYLRIADRRLAIARALEEARSGDTVLLAGKGHETYQVIGTEKLPFDEREIVASVAGA
jgi:UDP-N-acetylmuramoyl-L-alanyl-D-glutamate--2,6-diaminopimelate ligase